MPTTNQQPTLNPPFETVRLIAHQEAEEVILQHLQLCPFAQTAVDDRLRTLELRFATLIGAMFGSGLIGGAVGTLATHLLKI
jgi:hypothetical protein